MAARKTVAEAADGVAARMAEAREIGAKLSQITDTLNSRLALAEKDIAALGLGVSGWINISSPDEVSESVRITLGFQKSGAEWRLFMGRGQATPFGEDEMRQEETPLLKAPKAIRIRAAQCLGILLEHLVDTARTQLVDVEQAVQVLDGVLKGALPGNPNRNDEAFASGDDEIPF